MSGANTDPSATIDRVAESFIHRLFERQVEQAPNALAVVGQDESLTYAELNRRANQLAHYLRGLGVGPEVRVALFMERSPEMVVALLSVLKAGGAYVPLDPAYPAERLRFMLSDSAPLVMLVQAALEKTANETIGGDGGLAGAPATVAFADGNSPWAAHPLTNLSTDGVFPKNVAYVVYTSGSTGQPKGVLVEHGVAAAHFQTVSEAYELSPLDRVLQFASLSFDVSLEQIISTLISGSRLVLRPHDVWSAPEFLSAVNDLDLTVANLPTAYWHDVARLGAAVPALKSRLRLLIAGGDVMEADAARAWHQTAPASGAAGDAIEIRPRDVRDLRNS